jgi:uncharacterized DUF497 family protein
MDDELFDWDDANILHLAEHGVAPEEAEEVLLSDSFDAGFDVVDGEKRWSYIGETGSERILRVVVTLRGEQTRVVTAFEAERHWKLLYLKQKAGLQ